MLDLKDFSKEQLIDLISCYNRYIQWNCDNNDEFGRSWFPTCINEFKDFEYQDICKEECDKNIKATNFANKIAEEFKGHIFYFKDCIRIIYIDFIVNIDINTNIVYVSLLSGKYFYKVSLKHKNRILKDLHYMDKKVYKLFCIEDVYTEDDLINRYSFEKFLEIITK